MSQSSHPVAQVKAELFRAMAHPLRVRALEYLVDSEWSVSILASALQVDIAQLSQQLAIMRRAGIVATRREGNTVFYSVPEPGIAVLLSTARELIVASLETSQQLLSTIVPAQNTDQ